MIVQQGSLKARLIRGVSANAIGQALTIAIQLGSLPLFLTKWNLSSYGEWLVLSAIPAYLNFGDFGILNAACNRMISSITSGDLRRANATFHSATGFMLTVCLVAWTILFSVVTIGAIPGLDTFDKRCAVMALGTAVVLSLLATLVDIYFRSTGQYAKGVNITNGIRLAEWLGMICALEISPTYSSVAIGGLFARFIGLAVSFWVSSGNMRGLTWSSRLPSKEELAGLLGSGIMFMAFPVSNAMFFQGSTLVLNYYLGPSVVAVFNIYRTVSRIVVQAIGIYSNALWPEFASLYRADSSVPFQRLYALSFRIGVGLSALGGISLYGVFPLILQIWTHSHVPYIVGLAAPMVLYATAGGLVHVPRTALLATDNHRVISGIVVSQAVLVLLFMLLRGAVQTAASSAWLIFSSETIVALLAAVLARSVVRSRVGA